MPTALFVSPHLDDVTFSCGATLAALAGRGWRTVVATVCSASDPDPGGFALACQLDKGLTADVDYLALRRDEDAAMAGAVGRAVGRPDAVELRWVGLPEAPRRGYDSAAELFEPPRAGDDLAAAAADRLAALDAELRPALRFVPQALGGHVDHVAVVRAARCLGWTAAWYRDLPYALRAPDARPHPEVPTGLREEAVPVDGVPLEAKVAGACCYRTQLGFQFGGREAVGPALRRFAADEGARLGCPGPVEALLVPAELPTWRRR